MASFDIFNEPVRGMVPPEWFHSLSGLDRIRAWSDETMPPTPLSRLNGTRATHVVPGSVVCVMTPADMMAAPHGAVQTLPLAVEALQSALLSAAAPGQAGSPQSLSMFHFRPVRVSTGTILARARVVNAGSRFATAEATIEDSEGRQLAHCGMQYAFVTLDPAPPPAPSPLPRLEQPVWATPDPWQRAPGGIKAGASTLQARYDPAHAGDHRHRGACRLFVCERLRALGQGTG